MTYQRKLSDCPWLLCRSGSRVFDTESFFLKIVEQYCYHNQSVALTNLNLKIIWFCWAGPDLNRYSAVAPMLLCPPFSQLQEILVRPERRQRSANFTSKIGISVSYYNMKLWKKWEKGKCACTHGIYFK